MNLTVVSDYVNATTPVTLKCKVCGNEFESTMTYISNTSIGCKVCSQEDYRVQKLNDFIEILSLKNQTIKLIGEYTDMSTPTTFLCSECNKTFERTPHDLLRSYTCPNCTTNSKLEYFIKLYLDIMVFIINYTILLMSCMELMEVYCLMIFIFQNMNS